MIEAGRHVRATGLMDESPAELSLAIALPAVIGFAAMMFGTVEAWSFKYITLAMFVLWSFLCLDRVRARGERTFVASPIFILPLAFIALALLQITPLPASILGIIAPANFGMYEQLLPAVPSSVSISLDRALSAGQLNVLLLGVLVFVFTVQIFRTPRLLRVGLVSVSIVLAIVVLIQLLMVLTQSRNVLWVGPVSSAGARGGPFVHYNHYSFFVNVCACLCLGLVLSNTVSQLQGRPLTGRRAVDVFERPQGKLIGFLIVVSCIAIASIFLSGSRSGMLSIIAAVGVALILMWRQPTIPGGAWLFIPVVLLASSIVLVLALDFVFLRFGKVIDDPTWTGRPQVWSDAMSAFWAFPIFGIGLGAHASVFPVFDTSNVPAVTASHVENQYIQLLEETGLAGGLIFVVFLLMLVRLIAIRLHKSRSSEGLLMIGFAAALVAMLVHSITDFASHLPANTMLAAMVCGGIVAIARWPRRSEAESSSEKIKIPDTVWSLSTRSSAVVIGTVPLVMLAAWLIPASFSAASAESYRWSVALAADRFDTVSWNASPEGYRQMLISAGGEVRQNPSDINAAYRLNSIRWELIRRQSTRDECGTLDPQSVADASRLLDEIKRGRMIAPTHALSARLEAEVLVWSAKAVDDKDQKRDRIAAVERAWKLNPTDTWSCFELIRQKLNGEVIGGEVNRDQVSASAVVSDIETLAGRYLSLGGEFTPLAILLLTNASHQNDNQHDYQNFVQASASDSYERLQALAIVYEEFGKTDDASIARARSIELLRERAASDQDDGQTWLALARSASQQGDHGAAEQLYRKFLYVDGPNADVRLELARMLVSAGRVDAAARELELCMQVRPVWAEPRQLLSDITPKLGRSRPIPTTTPAPGGVK